MKSITVFLGGTCNNSTWRDELIPKLNIEFFNPVVEDWTIECMKEELEQRESCDICLYTITSETIGVYSIAELVDDSNKRPQKTVFCFLSSGLNAGQLKSLLAVRDMVQRNGVKVFEELDTLALYLNRDSIIKSTQ